MLTLESAAAAAARLVEGLGSPQKLSKAALGGPRRRSDSPRNPKKWADAYASKGWEE